MTLAYLPSPTRSSIHLGPIPVRAYAVLIIIGVIFAVWLGERRWQARGGREGAIGDIAVWAVPFGLLGGRLYHVITDYELYFEPGGHPLDVFKVWDGGLGIPGAIALGAVGAWIGARRAGLSLGMIGDAVAPGIVIAQAIGRWGNYFNNELYGHTTTMPWGLTIHDMNLATGRATGTLPGHYQPTFLYESLWCLGVAVLVIWADRRFGLRNGEGFALYVAAYTAGRAWIEDLRSDFAHVFLGLRINDWMSIIVFCGAVTYLVLSRLGRLPVRTAAAGIATTEATTTAIPGTADEAAPDEAASEDRSTVPEDTAADDSAVHDTAARDTADDSEAPSADPASADPASADPASADPAHAEEDSAEPVDAEPASSTDAAADADTAEAELSEHKESTSEDTGSATDSDAAAGGADDAVTDDPADEPAPGNAASDKPASKKAASKKTAPRKSGARTSTAATESTSATNPTRTGSAQRKPRKATGGRTTAARDAPAAAADDAPADQPVPASPEPSEQAVEAVPSAGAAAGE